MEWFVLTIAAWIVEKLLDAFLERWKTARATRTPSTDLQVLAYHRGRFRRALLLAVWCAAMLAGAIATAPPAPDGLWYVLVAFIGAAGLYAALRLPRYRRRVREARDRIAKR